MIESPQWHERALELEAEVERLNRLVVRLQVGNDKLKESLMGVEGIMTSICLVQGCFDIAGMGGHCMKHLVADWCDT